MRKRDYSLLTVGMGTISHDERFYVSHSRTTQVIFLLKVYQILKPKSKLTIIIRSLSLFQNWELHIKYVKAGDEGLYECQISTHPPSSIYITLRVVGKSI